MATIGFYIKFDHAVDSEALWEAVGGNGVNVTDLGNEVWIYGEASLLKFAQVVDYCTHYGKPKAEFFRKRGDHDENLV